MCGGDLRRIAHHHLTAVSDLDLVARLEVGARDAPAVTVKIDGGVRGDDPIEPLGVLRLGDVHLDAIADVEDRRLHRKGVGGGVALGRFRRIKAGEKRCEGEACEKQPQKLFYHKRDISSPSVAIIAFSSEYSSANKSSFSSL